MTDDVRNQLMANDGLRGAGTCISIILIIQTIDIGLTPSIDQMVMMANDALRLGA